MRLNKRGSDLSGLAGLGWNKAERPNKPAKLKYVSDEKAKERVLETAMDCQTPKVINQKRNSCKRWKV